MFVFFTDMTKIIFVVFTTESLDPPLQPMPLDPVPGHLTLDIRLMRRTNALPAFAVITIAPNLLITKIAWHMHVTFSLLLLCVLFPVPKTCVPDSILVLLYHMIHILQKLPLLDVLFVLGQHHLLTMKCHSVAVRKKDVAIRMDLFALWTGNDTTWTNIVPVPMDMFGSDKVLSTLTIWCVLVSGTNLVTTVFLVLLNSMLFSVLFIFQVLTLESHFEVTSRMSGNYVFWHPLRVPISLYFAPISVSKSSF